MIIINPKKQTSKKVFINEDIRSRTVNLIDSDGTNRGATEKFRAQDMADKQSLDLVLISPSAKPYPVAKIMDYDKYRYELQKKEKALKKSQKENIVEVKEIRLSPVVDIGDFNTKVKHAKKFIAKGNKVKINLKFRGRQMANKKLGFDTVARFWDEMSEVAIKESAPKMDGRNIIMMLSPIKEK